MAINMCNDNNKKTVGFLLKRFKIERERFDVKNRTEQNMDMEA